MHVKRPPERPLDPLPTLKLKLSVVILAAVAVTVIVFFIGIKAGIWPSVAGLLAGGVALAVVWVLARGITSPVRDERKPTITWPPRSSGVKGMPCFLR